jgi:hypothetical protein
MTAGRKGGARSVALARRFVLLSGLGLVFLIPLFAGCAASRPTTTGASMPNVPEESLAAVRARLQAGMIGYLEDEDDDDDDGDAPYTRADIDECMRIVDTYLVEVRRTAPTGLLPLVRDAVLRLNALNDRCEGALIETDQREDLCQILLVAARSAGMKEQGDVTEPWREW